ncbi:MAG: hypothetical protein CMM60_05025 [Rhodospirillaceae bacterium]|jgi:three-Cys-motif partner protein|nr:hypothetical protein [Rhodospirillaceae bacterium]|tara:strand:+ start:2356 stop:3267 length:912 start_codon:yes stop_codon:yes gene_type:complete
MTSYKTDGTVGPWAKEKLKILESYLDAYTKVLLNQGWCAGTIFIDAFAGAGRAPLRISDKNERRSTQLLFDVSSGVYDDKDELTYVNGSPRVALGLKHTFDHYFFIEQNSDRAIELQKLKEKYSSHKNINVLQDDANEAIKGGILGKGLFNWKSFRGIAFLDPFGMQLRWDTLEALASTEAIEIIINLPVGTTLQRLLPKSGQFSETKRQQLDEYFGSPDWYDVIYEKTPGLFGDEINKSENSGKRLALWYRSRLKELFGLSSPASLIRNSRGGHLYYLIWAGHHPKGLEIASHVLSQGEVIK